jgi:hypothetical protein
LPIPYLVAINVAGYNLYMWIDEYRYFTEIVIPYLKAHWDEIDLVETTSGERDGHLTKAELESARDHARERGDDEAADILHELIMRYDVICSAYPDSDCGIAETTIGISPADVSVYVQLQDPAYRKHMGTPEPTDWQRGDKGADGQ